MSSPHSDIAPDRKEDPGELFDWQGLASAGIGLWPEFPPPPGALDAGADAGALRANLAAIGYPVPPEAQGEAAFATLLRAFQRRWRPGAVTGPRGCRNGRSVPPCWPVMSAAWLDRAAATAAISARQTVGRPLP